MSRLQRRFIRVFVVAICFGLVAGVAWSVRIKQSSVDLVTGRERDRVLILGMCIQEQVRETPCSTILQSEENVVPDWRVFSETGPFQRLSPHFSHHSTPTILKETLLIGDLLNAPKDVRRQMCAQVLERLRNDDRPGARKLLDEWWKDGEAEQGRIEVAAADVLCAVMLCHPIQSACSSNAAIPRQDG